MGKKEGRMWVGPVEPSSLLALLTIGPKGESRPKELPSWSNGTSCKAAHKRWLSRCSRMTEMWLDLGIFHIEEESIRR